MSITVLVRRERDDARPHAANGSTSDRAEPSLTFDAPRIVLGRGEGCEVRLPDVSVSHRHATLRQRGAEYLLVDEGSTNGTRLGRVRLGAHSPRVLQNGDAARLGRVWVEFRIDGTMATRSAPIAAKEQALALVRETLQAAGEDGRPLVIVEEGPPGVAGRSARLDEGGRIVVGRANDAQIVVEDPDLSRRHVEIAQRGDVLVVRDLGSKVGTRIGDRAIGASEVVWRVGERLLVGGATVLSYTFPAVEALGEIEKSPDEKVAAVDLDTFESEGSVVDAQADPLGVPEDGNTTDDDASAEPDFVRSVARDEPRRVRWGFTDLAVVVLALGVLSLSAVGYFVLLR